MLHILGDPGALADAEGIGVVGARRASTYGLDVARAMGRGLSAAEVTVVSGLAMGIDSAAHAGALEGPGRTIGVLAASAHIAYPARGFRLHAAVAERGAVISEMPPGASAHRWCFVARNRIIAALAAATVVVQATERSGSLTTADFANELGRAVGAVPGQVTTRLSGGTHSLIQTGAPLIRDTEDALELLAGATGRVFAAPRRRPRGPTARPGPQAAPLRGRGRTRLAVRTRRVLRGSPLRPGRPRRARTPRPGPPRLRGPLGTGRLRLPAALTPRRSHLDVASRRVRDERRGRCPGDRGHRSERPCGVGSTRGAGRRRGRGTGSAR